MEPGATVNMFFKREIGEAWFNLFIRIAINFFLFFFGQCDIGLVPQTQTGFLLCLKHNFCKRDFQIKTLHKATHS